MDTTPEPAALPSSWSPALPPAAAPPRSWEESADLDVAPGRALTPRLVLQAVRRYWWQILLLWGIGSSILMTLVYTQIKPGYEATAWLEVKPNNKYSLTPSAGPSPDMDLFMQTQVQLLTSPNVLRRALLDPRVVGLPLVQTSADPKAKLRDLLRVVIPPKTSLILVSITTPQREDGPILVNALAQAYLEESSSWTDAETRKQLEHLRNLKERKGNDVDRYRGELDQLVAKTGDADPNSPLMVQAERYRAFRARLNTIEMERIEADVALGVLKAYSASRAAAGAAGTEPPDPELVVRQMFLADPEVAALRDQIRLAEAKVQEAVHAARKKTNDPAARHHSKHLAELKEELAQLWTVKQPHLRAHLAATPPDRDPIAQEIQTATLRLAKLQQEESTIRAEVEQIHIDTRNEGSDALKAQFLTSELNSATEMYRQVSLMLEQLQAEAQGLARISLISEARPSPLPARDHRPALLAATPVGVLAALVGLFVLVEARAGRVANPDDLATRLRLGVLGVVPPLPSLRTPQGARAVREQRRRVEAYIQSIDHLRVALCSPTRSGGPRRCVMITSASGGEGKTTLSAQLAGRCANAGLATVLVDADLRRPALGSLLEVPAGPGLAEVLGGTVTPEDALVVIHNAGGFHLLPAGRAGPDPSRLLQGERLGQLLARLREAFEVVIVDVPPILPVPDALLIGRWTDGAVVAVRHDASRFPLVERAARRLAGLDIPVLGAVVNGCRPAESAYGGYGYYGYGYHDHDNEL